MKHVRTVLLILLAVLLPIRGAVAAAMLCPGAQTGSRVAATVSGHHDTVASQPTEAQASAAHGHGHGHDHGHGHASNDSSSDSDAHVTSCQTCAGGCCVTPLAFAPPSVASPPSNPLATFPELAAKVTAHCPDGQDRPPRAI